MMDIDYDDIYGTPLPPPLGPTAPPKPTVDLDFAPKKRKRQSVDSTPRRRPPLPRRQPRAGPSNTPAKVINNASDPAWSIKSMTGDHAPYNEFACWIDDLFNHKVYIIGGSRSGDEDFVPTSDFYSYDTQTHAFEDLTDAFTFRDPFRPFSRAELNRKGRPLPALNQPGGALWRCGNTSFIFLFGGFGFDNDDNRGTPSSRVIMLNLHSRTWWYENSLADELGLQPRISPAVVAIGNRVYIFGGYQTYEDDPRACHSYSIAEWAQPSGNTPSAWRWKVRDAKYTLPMPPNIVIGKAISVCQGKLIFLTPGKTNDNDKGNRLLHFTDENLFYFRPSNQKFEAVPMIEGHDAPRDIGWYTVYDLQSAMAFSTSTSSPITQSEPDSRIQRGGRPRKRLPQAQGQPMFPAVPSIIICAWIAQRRHPNIPVDLEDIPEEHTYAPELYRFTFYPDNECRSLGISRKIPPASRDSFTGFVVAGGKMLLLGSDHSTMSARSKGHSWNIYLEIPSSHQQ